MSILRAVRKVTSPNGDEWELYVYRVELRWRPLDLDSDPLAGPPTRLSFFDAFGAIFELPFVILGQIVLPALYAVVRFPVDLVRGRGSRTVYVEAITWLPFRESYRWQTTRDHADRVLEQVSRGFASGDIPPVVLGAVLERRR